MTAESQPEEEAKVIRDVTCPVCGCSCDDIEVTVKDNKIEGVRHACRMGAAKFFEVSGEKRLKKPMIRKDGELQEVSWEEALDKTAQILVDAKRPALFGWAETSCEALQVGIKITEELGGIMDNCSSICHAPSILAIQKVGISTCTLGEVKNRADLIIYWGSNPQASHPRHLSRYSTYPRGKFRERGRQDREVIVIDVMESDTAKIADWFIQVKPNSDYEIFAAVRSLINGNDIYADEVGGVKKEDLIKLAEKMKSAQFGAIYFGLGLASSVGKSRNIENAIRLTIDLNRYTKFIIQAMRGHYNVAGTNQVLTWQHGFPYAVDFSKGYPEYNPGDTSIIDLLARKEVDAMLVIAADPGAHFPRIAVERMAEIPIIAVDVVENPTILLADVVLPGVIVGAESEGTCYRMDEVPIPLRKVVDPLVDYVKSDEELMEKLYERIMKIKKADS